MLPINYLIFSIILAILSDSINAVSFDGSYKFIETVIMHDTSKDPVGYQISANLNVQTVHSTLLLLQLLSPKLHIMSRKAPKPLGFIHHSSLLDNFPSSNFLIEIESGKLLSMYLDTKEEPILRNLKRGISSLFQFQTRSDPNVLEVDSSGTCNVSYSKQSNNIVKTKTGCQQHIMAGSISNSLWGGEVKSQRETLIRLAESETRLESVIAKEHHTLRSNRIDFSETKVSAEMELTFLGNSHEKLSVDGKEKEMVVKEIGRNFGVDFKVSSLTPEKHATSCNKESCPKLSAVVKENKKHLKDTEVGTSKSALAGIRVLRSVKEASAEEIYKVINAKENKDILPQLMDILGAAQTTSSHQAALKKLKINVDYNLDLCERYFWAISMSPHPHEALIKDMMKIIHNKHKDPKLSQTLVFTLAAMAKNYGEMKRKEHHVGENKLVEEVANAILGNLEDCKTDDEDCRQIYLKALANLRSPSTVQALLKHAVGRSKKTSVAAVLALSKLEPGNWSSEVCLTAERILTEDLFDTSARAMALDILLEGGSPPSDATLARITTSVLRTRQTPKELKEYLLQRFSQISEYDPDFADQVRRVFNSEGLFQYDALAPGGLSTAFSRSFMTGGTLSTTQEVSNGILKRGNVHINLEHDNKTHTLFTLGIFTSGLGGFVSSDNSVSGSAENSNDDDDDESATAGLDLSVLGVAMRRFIFFEGQGELMGHVWSGTASSKTPAYQAILLLGVEEASVALGIGSLAELSLLTTASVDLSGQIEISLWNRNAQSLVQNSAGLAIEGTIRVDSPLVKTGVEFNLLAEPQLNLASKLEFSDRVALCLQLQQPNSFVRYNTYKVERIPGSKHKLRKARYKTISIPGKTYALNMKNNEMCGLMSD